MNLGDEIDGIFLKLEETLNPPDFEVDPLLDVPAGGNKDERPKDDFTLDTIILKSTAQRRTRNTFLENRGLKRCKIGPLEGEGDFFDPAFLRKFKRNFQCGLCGAVCASRASLRNHSDHRHKIVHEAPAINAPQIPNATLEPRLMKTETDSNDNACLQEETLGGSSSMVNPESEKTHNLTSTNEGRNIPITPKTKPISGFPYHCKICGDGFQYRSYLLQHMQRRTGCTPSSLRGPGDSFVCKECDETFVNTTEYNFTQHVRSHGTKFKCPHCRTGFKCSSALKYHTRKAHSKTFHCPHCSNVQCESMKKLNEHYRNCHGTKGGSRKSTNIRSKNNIAQKETEIDSDDERFLEELEKEDIGEGTMNLGEEIDGVFLKLEEPLNPPDFEVDPLLDVPAGGVGTERRKDDFTHDIPRITVNHRSSNVLEGRLLKHRTIGPNLGTVEGEVDFFDHSEFKNFKRFQCGVCGAICASLKGLQHHSKHSHMMFNEGAESNTHQIHNATLPSLKETETDSNDNDCLQEETLGGTGSSSTVKPESGKPDDLLSPNEDRDILITARPRPATGFPYCCKICDHGFAYRSDLLRHVEQRTGCTPLSQRGPGGFFVCKECNESFSQNGFAHHAQCHGTEFKCPHCRAGFKVYSTMKYHEKRMHSKILLKSSHVHGAKTFHCPHCNDVQCESLKTLNEHYRNFHGTKRGGSRELTNIRSTNNIARKGTEIDSDDERFLEELEQEDIQNVDAMPKAVVKVEVKEEEVDWMSYGEQHVNVKSNQNITRMPETTNVVKMEVEN